MNGRSLLPFNWLAPTRYGGQTTDPFTALQREMDRLMESFGRPTAFAPSTLRGPSVDITETDKELVITAELPGLSEKDVEVTLRDDALTISGEKRSESEQKDATRHVVERSYGSFARSFQLPPGYDSDKISAHFDKGVLKVTLAKPEQQESKVKRIDVKSAT